MQLRGVSTINMDAKGRVVLPVRFREALMAASDGHLVVTIDMTERCLLLYPLAEWEGIQQQLEAMPNVDPRARRLQRLLIGHATDHTRRYQPTVVVGRVDFTGSRGQGATGDLTSSMATSLGIYTYILDETQIAGTAIPVKKSKFFRLTSEAAPMWNYS